MYYTVIKHSSHLRTLEKCRKHSPAARAFYISLVFSNACRVLSQCNTRLRLLYLLNMAVRMRKVLARPWVGVRVCHLLLLFFCFFFQKTSLVGLALVHTAQKDGHPFILYFFLSLKKEIIKMKGAGVELYGTANDPRTANDPGPQLIPDRK